jgi:hypothetical protein
MKIDIDSIFYIVLSIIILAVSGLGRRRKKQAQQMNKPAPAAGQAHARQTEEMGLPKPRGLFADPFEKLEQILMGQTQYGTLEGESLEVLDDEEEAIIIEEENLTAKVTREEKARRHVVTTETEDKQGNKGLDGLFGDKDEIIRAIIYSEILPRKYI